MAKKHSVLMGHRYVFFNSLFDEESKELQRLGENAANHFSHTLGRAATNSKTIQEEEEDRFSSFITSVAVELQAIASRYKTIEINFLKQHESKIQKYIVELKKDNSNNPCLPYLNELLQLIKKIDNSESINGIELITAFNLLRNNIQLYKTKINEMYEYLKKQSNQDFDINQAISLMREDENHEMQEITKTLKEWLLENGYSAYRDAFIATGLTPLENMISELQTQRMIDLIEIMKNSGSFLKLANKIGLSFFNGNVDELKNYLLDVISNQLSNDFKTPVDGIMNNIESLLMKEKENFFKIPLPKTSDAFSRNKNIITASFEEMAVKKAGKLTQIILDLSDDEKEDFLTNSIYAPYLSKKVKDILAKNNNLTISRVTKGNVTRSLQKAFETALSEQGEYIYSLMSNAMKNKTTDAVKLFLKYFRKNNNLTLSQDVFKKSLNVQLSRFDAAEIQSDLNNSVLNQVGDMITSSVPGKVINLKNDVVATITINPLPKQYYSIPEVVDLESYSKDFMMDFLKKYHAPNSSGKKRGETDVLAAAEIFKEKVKETNLKYQQAQEAILDQGASLEELNQYFENTFLNEISVKDYEFIHNDIGFKGGSLGGQFNALDGINTIYNMYALGGISVLDKDLLIEAVLNSGPDSVLMTRSPGVIDSVKNFLLGGAILAMFDAGFSQTTKFLSNLTSQYTVIPKTLELYQFGPLYIPASYVLQKVIEGLTEIGAQIEVETDNVKLSSSIEFSGQMTYNDINFNLTPSAARWNDISKRAQDNTKIYVLLAAGLLDLFENLPEILVSKLDF